jgi:hypothetical protein
MTQSVSTINYSINAKGDGFAYRAIAPNGTQALANSRAIGWSEYDFRAGANIEVNKGPTVMAEAGGIIDGTTPTLKTDATGRLVPTTAGTDVVVAIVKPGQTASQAGVIVEVIPTI